jgi:flavodoxin
MKSLVLYDSAYGNTAKIARVIYHVLAAKSDARLIALDDLRFSTLGKVDLLVVGSPTQGGRPTQGLEGFLKNLPPDALGNIRVAAFDTRLDIRAQAFLLRLVMSTARYAASKIARLLVSKGGELITKPRGFIVSDTEGPVLDAEITHAEKWAEKLLQLTTC